MRVLILSDSDSPHTIRWAKSIHQTGVKVGIFSISKVDYNLYKDCAEISLFTSDVPKNIQFKKDTSAYKFVYLKAIKELKKTIKIFNPDILHAHYASSYGFIGARTNFHPFIISVWGSDIYNFPNKSIFHHLIIKYNLSKADQILSTSQTMKKEIEKFTKKNIIVTPFGIQIHKFYPQKVQSLFNSDQLVIGTIKTLEKKYGIEYLIRAFRIVRNRRPHIALKLLIVGRGSLTEYLKSSVIELGLNEDTIFTGFVNHNDVEIYHNMLDIGVYASTEDSESFGVSVLESSACGKPVIVSKVGGLPEVVEHGKTGFIVDKKNPLSIADALISLIEDKTLRDSMGKNGIEKVKKEYDWNESVNKMISVYKNIMNTES